MYCSEDERKYDIVRLVLKYVISVLKHSWALTLTLIAAVFFSRSSFSLIHFSHSCFYLPVQLIIRSRNESAYVIKASAGKTVWLWRAQIWEAFPHRSTKIHSAYQIFTSFLRHAGKFLWAYEINKSWKQVRVNQHSGFLVYACWRWETKWGKNFAAKWRL